MARAPHQSDQTEMLDDAPVSKTRRKKDMLELQKMGEALIDLPPKQYADMPLPENLRDAVDAARGMSKRGALHRQKQFIGRVMRSVDPQPIRRALAALEQQDRQAARRFHRAEHWRDRLLDEQDRDAITDLCFELPDIDRQPLGQKVRAARREAATGKPVGARRALFRFIATHLDSSANDET
ncbi:MAG: ribosome biogenesis factor YjgA [Pseudomonadota bacterium]